MTNALANVAWEPCFIEPRPDRALEAYARRRFGMPSPNVRYLAAVPWVARAAIDLHPEFGLLLHVDQPTADLIGLVVSQENSCRFCYAAIRAMLWCQGMDNERIRRVEQDISRADLAPKSRAALEYARAQSRLGPAGAREAWTALRAAGVTAAEAREIAFMAALTDFHCRLNTMPAMPSLPFERMPEQWFMRLLRPLLDRTMRRHRFRGNGAPLPPGASDLPYGGLVAAFAGSPIAPMLARTLEEMIASPQLSRRCKLLIFAVVSRGLPCEVCEIEVGKALQREGFDAAVLSRTLAQLDAPELEPIERLLLPFVRETLWYEPAVLQRRTRALRDSLTQEQLIEAIGVASLANGLCRMAAVVMAEPA
jgi:alkylhydroperoxidase family enzyme